jgi:hypothetical protein
LRCWAGGRHKETGCSNRSSTPGPGRGDLALLRKERFGARPRRQVVLRHLPATICPGCSPRRDRPRPAFSPWRDLLSPCRRPGASDCRWPARTWGRSGSGSGPTGAG